MSRCVNLKERQVQVTVKVATRWNMSCRQGSNEGHAMGWLKVQARQVEEEEEEEMGR